MIMPLKIVFAKWYGKAANSNRYGLYECLTTHTDVLFTLSVHEDTSKQQMYYMENAKAVCQATSDY